MTEASRRKYPRLSALAAMACLTASIMIPARARAAEVIVKMLTIGKGSETNVFDPEIVRVRPGDRVHFVATAPGHNVQSIKNMMPAGALMFRSAFSQDFVVKFDKPGVYGYACMAHYYMGMVGLVVVGTPSANEEAAKEGLNTGVPSQAKAKFTKLFNLLDNKKS